MELDQPFPFWVRKQIKLLLKVTTAHPGSLVRLVAGSEVAVAPRPRRHFGQQAVITDSEFKHDGVSENDEPADTWLRLQVICAL